MNHQQNDQLHSPYHDDMNLMSVLSHNEPFYPTRVNKDRLSPFPDKKLSSFSPCSPRLQSPSAANRQLLSSTPIWHHLPQSNFNQFSDLQIPTMYGLQCNGESPLKRIGFSKGGTAQTVTERKLDFIECSYEHGSPISQPADHNKKHLSEAKMRKEITTMNTPSTVAGLHKQAHLSQNSRLSFDQQKEEQRMAVEEDDDQEQKVHSGHNRAKGLRMLSSSVKDIVFRLKRTTYKEVAQILIQDLLQKGVITAYTQDDQNVKRRVYDALNVLIAANILKKQGKIVMVQTERKSQLETHSKDLQREKTNLREFIQQKEKDVKMMMERARVLTSKFEALKKLTTRNKSLQINDNQKIMFPFIGVTYLSNSEKNKIETAKRKVIVSSHEPLEIMAQVDALAILYWNGRFDNVRTP